MSYIEEDIQHRLFELQDLKYKDFSSKLMTTKMTMLERRRTERTTNPAMGEMMKAETTDPITRNGARTNRRMNMLTPT